MTEYEAVVYDLDGTLVHLAVNWGVVASDVRTVYEEAAIDPPAGGLWELMDAAENVGVGAAVESAVADHEREGARNSHRLAHADDLLEREVPIGVCSLNCEAACRLALDAHGLTEDVDVVIGRDTVPTRKPNPEPLLTAIEKLGASPGRSLFIGDSPSDEETADRAGVAFEFV